MIQKSEQTKALTASTLAFTVCFAVWTIFSIIGVSIKEELGLSSTEFATLAATPVLTGALSRIFLGIWTDQFGGRRVFTLVMLFAALATFFIRFGSTYTHYMISALGIGLAGGSFAVGVAYVSKWYEKEKQGTALGIFGMGNVGAAITNFGAPFLLLALGGVWKNVAAVYAIVLAITAVLFFIFTKEDPTTKQRRETGGERPSVLEQLEPLKDLRVWRFSLYYFFVFGAFVSLAIWLPQYYKNVYGLNLAVAGSLAFWYSMPGSVFRALGGWLSDKFGARAVMYWTFIGSLVSLFFLAYPSTDYTVNGVNGPISFHFEIGLKFFLILTVALGFFMSLGKAAVYKHIPHYYPDQVGAVGGMVGLVGGLGGFLLPILYGILNDKTGIWTSCFMLLFILVAIALTWMHFTIRRLDRQRHPELKVETDLPEAVMD
ncbi:MAG: MFS transporter [Alphaproteobacteria bacterium]